MLKVFKIEECKMVNCDEKTGQILVYISPTKDECRSLIDNYNLDEHTLNSSLDPDEVSRLEFEDDHIAVILKRPENYSSEDNLLFKVTSIGAFLFKNKLIIVMPEDIQILENKHNMKLMNLNDVFLKLLYGAISHFLGHLKVINMISDSLEQKISSSMENKYLINMFTLGKSLVYYLSGIGSNGSLFEKIKISVSKFHFNEDQLQLLEDIIIENNQCNKQAEIYSNILTGLMDARGSIVNNNLNILIKSLTIINIVFTPINILASMGGMSEFTMMTKNIDWRLSYLLFTLGMIGIAFFTYFILNLILKSKERNIKKR